MLPDVLPFEDISFEAVLLDNVLEYMQSPPLISEIQRVLRPNGTLLIGVPGSKGMAHDPDHKVAYDEISLVTLANASGFSIREFFICLYLNQSGLVESLGNIAYI